MPLIVRSAFAMLALLLVGEAPAQILREEDGVAFVQNFFAAFDRRDFTTLQAAFSPDAVIVHDDGVQQTVPELMATLRSAKTWEPRQRTISGCTTQSFGAILVVGCLNHVEFHKPGVASTEHTYNETWVLERTAQGLRAVRSHYSLVMKKEHSEG